MKREYIAPEVNVVRIHANSILQASQKTLNVTDDVQTEGWADARGNNGGGDLWDE
ncbi:MAG: hypothetical protein J5610_03200 [Prevotella sp.]|nr:hypothetical protein [Prevotella sp.]